METKEAFEQLMSPGPEIKVQQKHINVKKQVLKTNTQTLEVKTNTLIAKQKAIKINQIDSTKSIKR